MTSSTLHCVYQYWRNESRSRAHRDWHRAHRDWHRAHRDWHRAYALASWTGQ